jgi:hypothetical protein
MMNIRYFRLSALGISAILAAAGSFSLAQAPENYQLVGANAMLVKNLDSKNASQGQAITAKLTSSVKDAGTTELPKGTILLGKVDQVQMSNNKGPAKLSIVFDKARLADGKEIPIKATLLSAYPGYTDSYTDTDSAINVLPNSIPSDQKIDQEPGTLSGVAMHSAVQSNTSGVFSSTDRNINLKSGTLFQVGIAPLTASATGQAGS